MARAPVGWMMSWQPETRGSRGYRSRGTRLAKPRRGVTRRQIERSRPRPVRRIHELYSEGWVFRVMRVTSTTGRGHVHGDGRWPWT